MTLHSLRRQAFIVGFTILSGLLILLTALSMLALLSASTAQASAYKVYNSAHSYRNVNIYNRRGCWGAHAMVFPGRHAPSDHDWKTFWDPAHSIAELHNYTNGSTYTISNWHDYPTCHSLGNQFSRDGWRTRLWRVVEERARANAAPAMLMNGAPALAQTVRGAWVENEAGARMSIKCMDGSLHRLYERDRAEADGRGGEQWNSMNVCGRGVKAWRIDFDGRCMVERDIRHMTSAYNEGHPRRNVWYAGHTNKVYRAWPYKPCTSLQFVNH